jgi:predicted amidohydrolase
MTRNGNLKRRVRARAAKTGEAYTAALAHIRPASLDQPQKSAGCLKLAVAQLSMRTDPGDIAELRAGGDELRGLMRQAHDAGARLVHFPEGAICWPGKRIMSSLGPREIGPSDWSRAAWPVLHEELEAVRRLARQLKLWVVLGCQHRLSPPHRPHNSLYVISDDGRLVTRYDERLLSHTKISFMYAPGTSPVTFEIDGIRFGCALGMETHYPEIFVEYEALDVDCVLFSTTGELLANAATFAAEALGHAASNSYWVSFSAHAPQSPIAPSGIASPDGRWSSRCADNGESGIAVATITANDPGHPARPWRRLARTDIYEPHRVVDDPRSHERNRF